MKKIITLIAIAVAGLSYSCADILDIQPVSNSQADAFYSTKEEVAQGLAGVYARLGRYGEGLDFPTIHHLELSESRSDNWRLAALPNAQRDMADLRYFNAMPTTGTVASSFNRLYSLIDGANLLLSKVTEDIYSEEVAQARFLRGYAYFELGRTWGSVPIVLKPIEKKDAPAYARSPLTDVYAQALDDLNYAKDKLPNLYTGTDAGRANAYAARTLMAYIYVTMAGYPLNDATAYGKAKDILAPIINDLGARFASNYYDIFADGAGNGVNQNKYDLFSVQFKAGNTGLGSSLHSYCTANTYPQWTTYGGSSNLDFRVDSLMINEMLAEDDVRAKHPAITAGYWTIKNPPANPTAADSAKSYTKRPYQMTKFLVKDIDKARVLASNDFDVNFPIVRTADAYLLYAEALVGTGQASMAKEWVDKVRVRAGIDPLATDPTMEEIFTERRKEFIGEGKRYYDLVRQGEAVFVNTLKVFVEHYELTSTYPGTTPTAADMLLPIPQPAMLVHPDWEQNPY